nr:hypothetical protein Iba_chr05eCG15010 [Ipomoea batatas]
MVAVLVSLVEVVPFHSSTMIADVVFDIDGFFSSFGVFMAESNLNPLLSSVSVQFRSSRPQSHKGCHILRPSTSCPPPRHIRTPAKILVLTLNSWLPSHPSVNKSFRTLHLLSFGK